MAFRIRRPAAAVPTFSAARACREAAPERRHLPLGNQSLQQLLSAGQIQAKLHVGSVNDPLERDADHAAEEVLRPRAAFERGGAPTPGEFGAGSRPYPVNLGTSAGGHTLDPNERAYFEARFGRDFGDVRIRTDAAAARSLHARAFTAGSDIVFGAGQYRPGTAAGRRLLAHELAHVVQNDGADRDTIRRKEDWDFTPADYAALVKRKGHLKLAADSGWVPTALCVNLLNTLRYVLDAKRSPSATEGINIFDFYHGHLVVPNNAKGISVDAMEARSKFNKARTRETIKALGGEFENVTAKNVAAYTKGIKATLPLLAKAVDEVVKIKGAAVMYHTFETTAQAKGIKPHDPRRNYLTPFDTNTPQPYKLPKGATDESSQFIYYLEFTFLVDQNGEVHVRPGGRDPLTTIIGKPLPW